MSVDIYLLHLIDVGFRKTKARWDLSGFSERAQV